MRDRPHILMAGRDARMFIACIARALIAAASAVGRCERVEVSDA
jgi:hypothetical protein